MSSRVSLRIGKDLDREIQSEVPNCTTNSTEIMMLQEQQHHQNGTVNERGKVQLVKYSLRLCCIFCLGKEKGLTPKLIFFSRNKEVAWNNNIWRKWTFGHKLQFSYTRWVIAFETPNCLLPYMVPCPFIAQITYNPTCCWVHNGSVM